MTVIKNEVIAMKLKIVGKPLALCRVNMKKFRKDMKKHLNLKKSIKDNFSIIENKGFPGEDLFMHIYFGLNWHRIIDLINDEEFKDKNEMDIRFFRCEFRDKVELTPDLISEDGRLFIFKQDIKDGNNVIMINSFLGGPSFAMESYLNSSTFKFGNVDWKPMIDL